MSSPTPQAVGKQQLLAWCAEMSQMRCTKLEDLKSGVVLLAVLFKVFPKLVERKLRVRWAPRSAAGGAKCGASWPRRALQYSTK